MAPEPSLECRAAGRGHNAESVYHETDERQEQPYKKAPETRAMHEPLVGVERA